MDGFLSVGTRMFKKSIINRFLIRGFTSTFKKKKKNILDLRLSLQMMV